MNNPTMPLVEPLTSLLENQMSINTALESVDLAPVAPSNMTHAMAHPKILSEVAQANIFNNNLSTLGLPGLIPLNAGAIGANTINAGTTASSNVIDANIIAGTGLFPIAPVPFTNTASTIPSQANIINGIVPSANLPGFTNFNVNANVPRSNIINGPVPFANLPGLIPMGQPNTAMNQNYLTGVNTTAGFNNGFMNAFNTGGGFGGFGGIGVSEPYGLFSIIAGLTLFMVIRCKKNIVLRS